MSDTGTLIATVPKNQREEVRVALDTFKGVDLRDVRVYANFDNDNDDGERRPTKKGVSVKVDKIRALIDALELAEAEAQRRGLLEPA
jgi:hypothetical protein